MTEWSDWDSSSSMASGWRYRIEWFSDDEKGEPINWTGQDRGVEIESPNDKVTKVTVSAEGTDPAVIEIELEEGSPKAFSDEFKEAVLSAVNLSTMPVVRWAESE